MTEFNSFVGTAKRLDAIDYDTIAAQIGVGSNEMHSLTDVECRSSGFDRHGRPAALFEPHLFYRNLAGQPDKLKTAIKAGLAYEHWGEHPYPADSYDRIQRARQIDENAALKSTSWGLGQILGGNHEGAGYPTVQAMVLDFMEDEENQLQAIAKLLVAWHIDDDLREHRWAVVARVWNGPAYAKQGYDKKLEAAFDKRSGGALAAPSTATATSVDSETLKTVQRRLKDLGYSEVGMPDGKMGSKTRGAILGFRADHGLPVDVNRLIDDSFMAALLKAQPRPVSQERADATVSDLRQMGSKTILAADKAGGAGVVLGGIGGLAGLGRALDQVQGQATAFQGILAQLAGLKDTAIAIGPWLVLAVGAYIAWEAYKVRQQRLLDHQSGKSAAPGSM